MMMRKTRLSSGEKLWLSFWGTATLLAWLLPHL